jgi:hypothetical protein
VIDPFSQIESFSGKIKTTPAGRSIIEVRLNLTVELRSDSLISIHKEDPFVLSKAHGIV